MFNKKENEQSDKSVNGIANSVLPEPIPSYNAAACEQIFEGKNNTYIVMGRDRPAGVLSGYGGKGSRRAGSIDIVTGRTSAVIVETEDGKKIYTDPSIPFDAARILISQKTDVDENFYLPNGKVGNRKNRSAAIIKADNVRLIAREGMKLVCNVDRFDSNGELKVQKFGIDLIATDGSNIQPIPKGDNLSKTIADIYEKIAIAGSTSTTIISLLLTLLGALAFHTHPTAVGPSAPSIELGVAIAQLSSHLGLMTAEAQNVQLLIQKSKLQYLNPASKEFINSLFHNLD